MPVGACIGRVVCERAGAADGAVSVAVNAIIPGAGYGKIASSVQGNIAVKCPRRIKNDGRSPRCSGYGGSREERNSTVVAREPLGLNFHGQTRVFPLQ